MKILNKQERQQFYDELLIKILALPNVQDEIEELRKDDEWNKQYGWGEFQFAENALENFVIQGKDEDVLAVSEIWNMVREEIRGAVIWVTFDAKTFINEQSSLDAEDICYKKLEEINEELYNALRRKHGK